MLGLAAPCSPVVLKLEGAAESPSRLINMHVARHHPRVSESRRLGWSLRIDVANEFRGAASVWGATL